MADKFFDEESQVDEQTQEEQSQSIKIGDREFTQEELDRRIGLSDIALEAEEKYNRPISKFWPEYTKSQQELEKIRAELEAAKQAQVPQQPVSDQEQVTAQAREELKKLGYVPAEEMEQRARAIASEVVSGYKLIDQVDKVVAQNATDGNPQTSREDLLEFMQEKNIPDPELAYKIKYEKELDRIKEQKLQSIKPQGLFTESSSTAGSKQPQQVKITRDNLEDVLKAHLRGGN